MHGRLPRNFSAKMREVYHGHLVLISTFLLNFCAVGAFNTAGLYLGPLSASFQAASTGELALFCVSIFDYACLQALLH